MDWAKIIADSATYPDSLEFTINGQAVTLGSLRAHNTQTHGQTQAALQQREQQLAERETRTTQASERLANIIENVAKSTGLTFEQIVSGDSAAAQAAAAKIRQQAGSEGITRTADGGIDWTNDPIYRPVDDRFRPIETQTQQLQTALRAGLNVVQSDRTELAYLRFKVDNPELAKKVKYEDAVKRAVDAGYKDAYGFPDVSKALGELAQPIQLEGDRKAWESEAEKRGYEKARAEMLGGVPQPGGGASAGLEFVPNPDKNAGKVTSIAEKLSQAMSDPDILRGVVNG